MANNSTAIMSQSDFLNELDWDEKVENFFIDFLSKQCRLGYNVYGKSNVSPVPLAIDVIRQQFGLEFTLKHCMKKLASIEQRYNLFTWMLSLDGVVHDPVTNKVHVPDSVWAYISKTESNAFAYHTYGESKLDELTTIFGPSKYIKEHEVIVISSGTSERNDAYARENGKEVIVIDDDTISDELVCAPPSKGKGKAKRMGFRQTCLWDYVNYDSDNSLSTQFSTANTSMRGVDEILNQARKKSPMESVVKTKGKMVTSSCASNDLHGNPANLENI